MTRSSHKNNFCIIIEEENEMKVPYKAENSVGIWKHKCGKKVLTEV